MALRTPETVAALRSVLRRENVPVKPLVPVSAADLSNAPDDDQTSKHPPRHNCAALLLPCLRTRGVSSVAAQDDAAGVNCESHTSSKGRAAEEDSQAASKKDSTWIARLFGRGVSSAERLAVARDQVSQQLATQTERLQEQKAVALAHHRKGQRADALAAMAKVRIHQKAVERTEKVQTAIETQMMQLDELEMQRVVSTALKHSAGAMKKACKKLSVTEAEKASDDIASARDTVDDVNDALAQLGSTFELDSVDSDELQMELDAMLDTDSAEPLSASSDTRKDSAKEARESDAATFMSQWPAVPKQSAQSARRGPERETARLMQGIACSESGV